MAYTLLVHLQNEAPFMAEVDELPKPHDMVLVCNNPRRRDGKDVDSFLPEVITVLLPWARISFAEVMPSGTSEELLTFVRE